MKMYLLIFLSFISITSALPEPFDFVEESIRKYVTNETDPCDNFYRHACPLGSPTYFLNDAFKHIIEELKANETFAADSFEISSAFVEFKLVFEKMLGASDLVSVFKSMCNNSSDLNRLQIICDMANKMEKLPISLSDDELTKIKNMREYPKEFEKLRMSANVARAHIDANIQKGILETKKLGEELLKVAEELLVKTPWAQTHNVTEQIANHISKIHLYTSLENELIELQGALISIDKFYSECTMKSPGNSSGTRLLCLISTMEEKQIDVGGRYFFEHNARNFHPIITFGFPSLYHAQYAKEYASKLGFVGWTFAHEIAHSFISDHYDPQGIGFFSKKAQDCIQNQYDKTCKYYKEKSCITADIMLDDNGSDIFGMQLAYKLLENHYGENMTNMVPGLGVSYEQLFFYAFAYPFCTGSENSVGYRKDYNNDKETVLDEHSARNVRINAVAQHPGFKKAFNCPDNSKMMQSATEQCIVYGEGAPETRKKL